VVVGQLACFGAEAEVGRLGQLDRGGLEAFGPLVYSVVLEVDAEGGFGEVGQADFGGDVCLAEGAGLLFRSLC